MKIKKGDNVKIISGKDKGKNGKVTRVMPDRGRLVVDGANLVKKHERAKKKGEKGQRVTVAAPINSSNVQLICPKCGKPTRVGFKVNESKKLRLCKKCNAEF